MLFMDHIYRQIVDVMGVVMEFGTRWGPNLAQFSALRAFTSHLIAIGKLSGLTPSPVFQR